MQNVIAPVLTTIFQKSLTSGTIPSDWKHTNACPVYKKGDKHDPKTTDPFLCPAFAVNFVNILLQVAL